VASESGTVRALAIRWGIPGWAGPISGVTLDARASLVDEEVPILWSEWPHWHARRSRFQASLYGANEQLDASPRNLAALQAAARDLIDAKKDDLKRVADLLLASR
jgi:hypothetical protein